MGIMARDGILDLSCGGRSIIQVTSLLEAGPRLVSFCVGVGRRSHWEKIAISEFKSTFGIY